MTKVGHDIASDLDTEGEGGEIEEALGLPGGATGEDSGLNSSSVGDDLIGVAALGGLLAVEVGYKLGDKGGAVGTTGEEDLAGIGLVGLGVAKSLLDGLE